jgi:segregation and condensation protein A
MSDPQIQPAAPSEAATPEASRIFEEPKGFETRFRGLPLHLTSFEGPLDLLLHLIREQKLDLVDLPMAEVTRQYMDYLLLMEELNLEIAAEFIAMAAQLIQIKSRLLLPLTVSEDGTEEDPRVELVQKLIDYRQVKDAAQELSLRESTWRDVVFVPGLDVGDQRRTEDEPIRCTLFDLLAAYREALRDLLPPPPVEVRTPPKSLEQRIAEVLGLIGHGEWTPFHGLVAGSRTREELVLTFLALLELVRTGRIHLVQVEAFGEIRVQAA